MVSASDFTDICNWNVTDDELCTPQTCCLDQGQIRYIPNLAGNALFAAIFGILIIPNLFFGIRYKTWSFLAWLVLGLVGEVVGYIGRLMLNDNIFSFDGFLMYLIPLTIAPAFITASIYLCLARVICVMDPNLAHTRLKPMTYTKIFVTFDIISLILQGAGGGVAATADDQKMNDMGVNIMIAGLAFQVFSLVVFIGLCGDFAWRLYRGIVSSKLRSIGTGTNSSSSYALPRGLTKRPTWVQRSEELGGIATIDYAAIKASKMFKGFIGGLVVATILILVRSVYRLAELQEGFDGELANHEVTFMILEGPMIILSCIGLTIFHPGLAMRGLWSMESFNTQSGDTGEKLMMTSTVNSAVHSRSGSAEDVGAGQSAPTVGGQRYESITA